MKRTRGWPTRVLFAVVVCVTILGLVFVAAPLASPALIHVASATRYSSSTTITTLYGKVSGVDAGNDSWAWKGIPYAKPPVGELRWKAPQDPDPWEGIRRSTEAFSACTQPAMSRAWIPLNQVVGSEDCLYLNVYRPMKEGTNLPVYVWIHGGSNVFGSAASYDASVMASTLNMVVVVIQYRLGPFGWFIHPALNVSGTGEDKSGNYGTLDAIKALKWVRGNIAFFGGNPNNVTVGGESAGAFDTSNLLISPLAKGLFHRAVMESSGGSNVSVEQGVKLANDTIDRLLVLDGTCPDTETAAAYRAGMTNADLEAYLRSRTTEEIERARMNDRGSIDSSPTYIDGVVIPGDLAPMIASGNYNRVPVILGSNQYELKAFLPLYYGTTKTSKGYTWFDVYKVLNGELTLDEVFGEADKVAWEKAASASTLAWNNRINALASSLQAQQDNVYVYYFKWGGVGSGPAPFDFIIGPSHATEIPFFFGGSRDVFGYSFVPENELGRTALQRAMMSYLGQFAATGNPNIAGSGLPVWEQWSDEPNAPNVITFDGTFTSAKIEMINWVLP